MKNQCMIEVLKGGTIIYNHMYLLSAFNQFAFQAGCIPCKTDTGG